MAAPPSLFASKARLVLAVAGIVLACALFVLLLDALFGGGQGDDSPVAEHEERAEVTTDVAELDANGNGLVDGAYGVEDLDAAADPQGEGWMEGTASAYSPEDNDGGTATASGIPLDDESLTVAVPQSDADKLGAQVDVFYGGITVRATVTDTGSFGDYGRDFDLAPAVWEAFGADSIDDWGVREVSYRYVEA